jgi:hypothetical protein
MSTGPRTSTASEVNRADQSFRSRRAKTSVAFCIVQAVLARKRSADKAGAAASIHSGSHWEQSRVAGSWPWPGTLVRCAVRSRFTWRRPLT